MNQHNKQRVKVSLPEREIRDSKAATRRFTRKRESTDLPSKFTQTCASGRQNICWEPTGAFNTR